MALTRTTVYLDPQIHKAVKMRAAQMAMSISDVITEALQMSLREDAVDLKAVRDRVAEPSHSYETVLRNLKKDGLL